MSDTRAAAPTAASTPPPAVRGGTSVDAAVLFATARAGDGGPAALLPWEDGTLLGRLVGQLAALGVPRTIVVTRPAWEADVRAAGAPAEVVASPDVQSDLRAVTELARTTGGGGLVAMYGDIACHREALAGLLADPRVTTGVLTSARARAMVFRIRARRGRVLSAGSAYHAVHRPTTTFLGVLKVAPADLPALIAAAEHLAPLSADPPKAWLQELERKKASWRLRLAAGAEVDETAETTEQETETSTPAEAEGVVLAPEDEERLRNRLATAPDDAVALLLVGLVRGGAQLGVSQLRRLYWSRPLTAAGAAEAEREIAEIDEDRVLLDSAVKGSDGFFTTFFVSPYSRYIARWAARRGMTPNQVTTISVLIGLVASIAFATGERWGLIAGAILLQLSFTTDCVDGQLARYTRQFSKLGAWLDSVFDRTKEYMAFAGLAIGASQMGDPVWLLACAAITAQTVRHMSDFSFGGAQQQAIGATPQPPVEQGFDAAGAAAEARRRAGQDDAPKPEAQRSAADRVLGAWRKLDRAPGVRWIKKMIHFPIGERFALISITAALFTPRVTFTALLVWAAVAGLYTQAGRVLRSLR
ncbi:MAG TPA: CDP-alcohol phosphatidyltransferase family protein [Solirubrobacteraceae bacterium]|nr:CDP-alcohol phosphatidyltransferase family protein [Solirubrobacteraceae bacterium]